MSTRKYLQMKKHLPLEERVAQIFLERIGDWPPPYPWCLPLPLVPDGWLAGRGEGRPVNRRQRTAQDTPAVGKGLPAVGEGPPAESQRRGAASQARRVASEP